MTAPDVRTAAQAEAELRVKPSPMPIPGGGTVDLTQHDRDMFVAGAVWGAALVTPTREQIAEALWDFPENVITLSRLNELAKTGQGDYCETRDYVYAQADAVLALIKNLTGRNPND